MPIIQVYNKILNTYPFLMEKEKRDFIKKAEPFLEKALKTDTPKDKVLLGRSLLAILDNGHADLHTVNPRHAHHKKASELKPRIKLLSKKRILFITIPSWNKSLDGWQKKLADECVQRREKYDTILIDIRENSGGNSRIAHDFASIFFRRPVMYGTFVSRGKNSRLKKTKSILKPNGKVYIDVPIAILISNKCFSSTELFLAPFKISKRATLIGTSTRGGSANPIREEVTIGGIKMVACIPQWRFFLKGEKRPIEITKIKPDISYSKSDIVAFAERYLTNQVKSNRIGL